MCQARRYLTDMVLVNDNKKSNLTEISEVSGEYRLSSKPRSVEMSMRGALQSIQSSVDSDRFEYSPKISSLRQDPISKKGGESPFDQCMNMIEEQKGMVEERPACRELPQLQPNQTDNAICSIAVKSDS